MSFGHERTIAWMHMWLDAQDLQKINPVNSSAGREGACLSMVPLTVDASGDKGVCILKGGANRRSNMQWVAPIFMRIQSAKMEFVICRYKTKRVPEVGKGEKMWLGSGRS